jgi:hypothetical protein
MPDERSMTDLDQPATRRDLGELRVEMHAGRDELRGEMHASRDELRAEMHAFRDELRRHMDVTAERLIAEMRLYYDAARTWADGLNQRVTTIETDHGTRLTNLELRTTRLERRKP